MTRIWQLGEADMDRLAAVAARAAWERDGENYERLLATGRYTPGDRDEGDRKAWDELTPEVRERFIAPQRPVVAAVLAELAP